MVGGVAVLWVPKAGRRALAQQAPPGGPPLYTTIQRSLGPAFGTDGSYIWRFATVSSRTRALLWNETVLCVELAQSAC